MTALSTSAWAWFSYQDRPSEKMACTTPRSFMNLSTLKRKRSGSVDSSPRESGKPPAKLQKAVPDTQAVAICQRAAVHRVPADSHAVDRAEARDRDDSALLRCASGSDESSAKGNPQPRKLLFATKMDPQSRDRLRERIVAQIDLEILLKHDEHRLIDQEIAKCQIALEQIRRCSIIPFPGEDLSSQEAEHVSAGTGPALDRGPGMVNPPHAAPWGVTDGPYTQHYARWLIPDPQFDVTTPGLATPTDGRPLRSSVQDRGPQSASRTHRFSLDPRFTSLAGVSAQPKEKARGPPIHAKPDGTMVKMICRHCGKDDASSMQGFLNHCRIAHQITFGSHADAANDCGIPLAENEAAVQATPDPLTSRVAGTPLAHAFNQSSADLSRLSVPPAGSRSSAQAGDSQAQQSSSSSFQATQPRHTLAPAGSSTSTSSISLNVPSVNVPPNPAFVPSSQLPKLSAFLQKTGFSGDLNRMVESAKERCPIDEIESLPGDDEDDVSALEHHAAGDGQSASTATAGVGPAISTMRVPTRNVIPNSQSSSFEHTLPTSPLNDQHVSVMANSSRHGHGAADLSPSATSTNPGLVSDCEDDAEDDIPSEYEKGSGQHQHHVTVRSDADGDVHMFDESSDVTGVSKQRQQY